MNECIYVKVSGSNFILLVLYLDDILLASNNLNLLYETKGFLSQNFEMKDMDETSYIIDIEIHKDRSHSTLGLSQKAYIEKVLVDFECRIALLRIHVLLKVLCSI